MAAFDGTGPDVLLQRMESGEAYVDVHPSAHPSDEVRGTF